MATNTQKLTESEREIAARYQARLEQEVARLREQSRKAVEDFKRTFPPPSDGEIEKLLYPELSEFAVELGGRRFVLRELPALTEKKFLRLVEQRLPALVTEILMFDERLGDSAAQAFTQLLARAGTAMDLVSDACVLVLDPVGEAAITREFVQQHASTARQLRILQAQLLLNGARDFLSRLFREPEARVLSPAQQDEGPSAKKPHLSAESSVTHGSPPSSVGSSSSASPPGPSPDASPSDNWP